MRRRLPAAMLMLFVACGGGSNVSEPTPELLATYYPTPEPVVKRMLELADIQPGEVHFDLGSGDGRIVVTAAREFDARSVGFEIDDDLIKRSRRAIGELGVEDRAEIRNQDLMQADYASARVITCFLTPEGLEKVVSRLEQTLRRGSRVVSYKFPLPGWTPDAREEIVDEDPEIPLHELFLYRWDRAD